MAGVPPTGLGGGPPGGVPLAVGAPTAGARVDPRRLIGPPIGSAWDIQAFLSGEFPAQGETVIESVDAVGTVRLRIRCGEFVLIALVTTVQHRPSLRPGHRQ